MLDTACGLPGPPCLFNLNASMTEHEDLASEHPEVVQTLLARFLALGKEYHPPQRNPPLDVGGYCGAVGSNRNFVGPWMNKTDEQLLG